MLQKKENRGIDKDNHIESENGDILNRQADQYYLFQTLINNIPDYVYIKDTKSRFIIVNKAMADFLELKPDNFIGKTDFDFYPKKSSKKMF